MIGLFSITLIITSAVLSDSSDSFFALGAYLLLFSIALPLIVFLRRLIDIIPDFFSGRIKKQQNIESLINPNIIENIKILKEKRVKYEAEGLVPNSIWEEGLYIFLQKCECGESYSYESFNKGHSEIKQGKPYDLVEVKCKNCNTERIFTFDISRFYGDSRLDSKNINPFERPSSIIDVVQWSYLAQLWAFEYENMTEYDSLEDKIKSLINSKNYIDEALKFYPPGSPYPDKNSFFNKPNNMRLREEIISNVSIENPVNLKDRVEKELDKLLIDYNEEAQKQLMDLSNVGSLIPLFSPLDSKEKRGVMEILSDLILNNLDSLAEKNNYKSCLKCSSPPIEMFSKDKKENKCDIFIVEDAIFKPFFMVNEDSIYKPFVVVNYLFDYTTPIYIKDINKDDSYEYTESFFKYHNISEEISKKDLIRIFTYSSIPVSLVMGSALFLANPMFSILLAGIFMPVIGAVIAGKIITDKRIKKWLKLKGRLEELTNNITIEYGLSALKSFCPDLYEPMINCINKGQEEILEFEENIRKYVEINKGIDN